MIIFQSIQKGYVAFRNTTFKLHDVRTLFKESRDYVTPKHWQDAHRHTEELENRFHEIDGLKYDQPAIMIDLGEDEVR